MTKKTNTAETGQHSGLERAVGAPLLFAVIVGDTLGAGIYTLAVPSRPTSEE